MRLSAGSTLVSLPRLDYALLVACHELQAQPFILYRLRQTPVSPRIFGRFLSRENAAVVLLEIESS